MAVPDVPEGEPVMSVPPEAVTAAALVIHRRNCPGDGVSGCLADNTCDGVPLPSETLDARAALEAAEPLIRAGERERIYAELGTDHHVIYTEDRWTIEHSVECRLSGHMHECPVHQAIAAVSEEYDPAMAGRWRVVSIDSGGLPDLERADLLGGDRP